MSLFLGKIHYWLFNKVLWFEGLEEEIINLAQEEGLDVNTLGKEIKDKYGKRTENKNLEEIIDTREKTIDKKEKLEEKENTGEYLEEKIKI